MSTHNILTLARYTVWEAKRTRLLWIFVIVLATIVGASYFLQQLAITESTRVQIAFTAALTRFAAVCVLSMHILTSVTREFNDKGLELTLSFALPRSHYVLGRLLGFLLIAFLIALTSTVPQVLLAPTSGALLWGCSLAFELCIMAALSFFCIVTFTQLVPAASFVFAFYVLARALSAIRLISDHPITGGYTLSHHVMALLVDALALVLPGLDRYAQTGWLVDRAADWGQLGANAGQALLYGVLLAAAAMFDFYRRNL